MVELESPVSKHRFCTQVQDLHSVEVVSIVSVGVTVIWLPPAVLEPDAGAGIEDESGDE